MKPAVVAFAANLPGTPAARRFPQFSAVVLLTAALFFPATLRPVMALTTDEFRRQVEDDWLKQEQFRHAAAQTKASLTPADDARGGCDGVKDGKWGFHTAIENNPWWQVDLGVIKPVARLVIWNRCDAASRANRLSVLLSTDGKQWNTVYTHNGTVFNGMTDNKPLEVSLNAASVRFVRLQLPGKTCLHLDEVEVFGPANPRLNLALNRPADQSSISQWSRDHQAEPVIDLAKRVPQILAHCERLAGELSTAGVTVDDDLKKFAQLTEQLKAAPGADAVRHVYFEARWLQRKLALANPLLNPFDTLLITKRVPGSFNHMSDQYYGWWSRPGGGLYLLRNFRGDAPTVQCISGAFAEPGSFLRPALSHDGKKVLFAWCKHYPTLAAEKDKLNKANVPEDAFYHVFEMRVEGGKARQLTHGKYDDFDARYLPDGRIVFMSTRRGQFIQAGRASACLTQQRDDLPDSYVRCGGGPERPVAVYTLHTMNADGSELTAISPFEMFEWEPSVAHDGRILYSRWDYIDRDNMPYMSLWSVNPDGTNPRIVYKNYTRSPHCTFEPRAIPNSHKIIFTASGHHSQTMGSLVLLDPAVGSEGAEPVTRLTPEVAFPEIEGWPRAYYANPWPLSERFHLATWGYEGATHPGPSGWNRWHSVTDILKGMGIYFFDAAGNMELLYRDPEISCMYPLPVMPQPRPPVIPSNVDWDGPQEGRFLLSNVYQGLSNVERGEVKALRIVAVPPKTHPTMNFPNMGVTRDDPGKCVLGTVPVESDGSAYFRVPAGVIVFFQALDAEGKAIQTMRSITHVQPGQTLSCSGCHEPRHQAPPPMSALAAVRAPSKITVGPEGSWPLRFDQLVQPVLDRQCVSCHSPQSKDLKAAKFDLTPAKAYDSLVRYGKPSLYDQVWTGYRRGTSIVREGLASQSRLLALLTDDPKGHYGAKLDRDSRERLIVWMDAYAQKTGSFSAEQEKVLEDLRAACADLLIERGPKQTAASR